MCVCSHGLEEAAEGGPAATAEQGPARHAAVTLPPPVPGATHQRRRHHAGGWLGDDFGSEQMTVG